MSETLEAARLEEALRHHDPNCGAIAFWPEPSQWPCHCQCKKPYREIVRDAADAKARAFLEGAVT